MTFKKQAKKRFNFNYRKKKFFSPTIVYRRRKKQKGFCDDLTDDVNFFPSIFHFLDKFSKSGENR